MRGKWIEPERLAAPVNDTHLAWRVKMADFAQGSGEF
jgi:hypothetical protein